MDRGTCASAADPSFASQLRQTNKNEWWFAPLRHIRLVNWPKKGVEKPKVNKTAPNLLSFFRGVI